VIGKAQKLKNNTTVGLLHHLQFKEIKKLNSNLLKSAPEFYFLKEKKPV